MIPPINAAIMASSVTPIMASRVSVFGSDKKLGIVPQPPGGVGSGPGMNHLYYGIGWIG